MDRVTQHLLLVLLGGITLRVALGDAHLAYVKAGFQPVLVGAGIALLALGLWGVVRDRPRADESPDDHGQEQDHGPGVAWLLLLPVAVLLLVAPPALGSYTAARQAQQVVVPADEPVVGLGADATAFTVVVDAPRGELAADQWVEVVGRHAPSRPHPSGGWPEAVIAPESVTPVEAPIDTYGA